MANADIAAAFTAIQREMIEKGAEKVPPGWYTAEQIAAARGVMRQTVESQLRRLGVECREFRIRCGNRLFPVKHYNLGKRK